MLKYTGIVRRMDDLGRIVFPKELRKQMGLKENDPFELGIAETEDGQKYLYAAPYKPSQDPFEKFANTAMPLLRHGGVVAIFSMDKALREIRQSGFTEAQCWQLASALRETIYKHDSSTDCEVINLDGGWPLYVVARPFACNGTPAGYIMLGQASKDATCIPGLQMESQYMSALAEQVFEKVGWM